jgi:heat shock protein HslJ
MKKIITILLIVVFMFLTVISEGCSSGKSTTENHSPGSTEWILETMNGTSVISLDDNNVTLKFDETTGRISGKGSCNSFFGSYKLDGTALKFSEIGSTKMMCDDMQIETDYFAALKKTDKHEIKGGKLRLLSSSAVLLIFRKK